MGLTRVTGNIIGLGVSVSGIVTATDFQKADGTPVGGGGLGTAISESNEIYFVDNILGIGATVTVTVPDTTGNNLAYTQYPEIAVDGDADLIISDGDDLLVDVLGISTDPVVPRSGSGGRVRADNFTDNAGTGAPTFNAGLQVTGVATATSFSGNVTGNLTGDVTGNLTGDVTATTSITVGDSFIKPRQVGIGTTTTVGRDALTGTAVGTIIYNSTNSLVQVWTGQNWDNLTNIGTGLEASGGIINDYKINEVYYRTHTFSGSGSLEITKQNNGLPAQINYLVVAGGGGGSTGGGGAGGMRTGNIQGDVVGTTYPVVVGSGGNRLYANWLPEVENSESFRDRAGNDGSDSTFSNITSTGGGGGGAYGEGGVSHRNGRPGGSGGGGGGLYTAQTGTSGGTGTSGQGNAGGASSPIVNTAAGGGGGSGGVGGDGGPSTGAGGAGGVGTLSAISGISTHYAGGGGGGGVFIAQGGGIGGLGGGGTGSYYDLNGVSPYEPGGDAIDGQQFTGGGGGGYGDVSGAGGSGVVIVQYQISDSQTQTAKATGGMVSFYDGKTIHSFTGTGTFDTPTSFSESCEYVLIGGGAAGGFYSYRGGGGGAGAYKTGNTPVSGANSIAVTIGAGGRAPSSGFTPSPGANGNNTSIAFPGVITAPGGGTGGVWTGSGGVDGGSGGGAGGGPAAPGSNGGSSTGDPFPGTIGNTPSNGWGHDGGHTAINQQQGAGGGGAGQAGYPNGPTNTTPTRGFGGAGIQMPATFRNPEGTIGTPGPNPGGYYIGGGGNGGGYPPAGNSAVNTTQPIGGGGFGRMDTTVAPYDGPGGHGLHATGSGGGGANYGESPVRDGTGIGGQGGSGIVLIAYPT